MSGSASKPLPSWIDSLRRAFCVRSSQEPTRATTASVELPAGTLEPPEEPVKTALRELAEETGYRAAHIEHLTTLCMSPGILDEVMYVYAASGLTAGAMALEAGEDIRVLHLTWEEALEMVRSGRIRDAKSVAALLYFNTFRRRPA